MHSQAILGLCYKVLGLILTIALLLSSPFPVYAAANQIPDIDESLDPATCELYPIALSADSLVGMHVGDTLPDIYNGTQPGNFGWLTWAGSPSTPTLVTSLTPPGDSSTYINPDDPADTTISVGDWIQGRPGVSNGSNVRQALDTLTALDIAVPVWDSVRGQGNNSDYRVVAFARVHLLDYKLVNENRISAQFLGYTCEGAVIELSKSADSTILTPTMDLDLDVSQSEALPGDELTYTITVNNTGTVLTLSGMFAAENVSDVVATVAYYDDFIEYQIVANDEWVPLAGVSATLPGYVPVSPAPLTSGITLEATGIPASGVVYPTEGDGIVGTQLEPGSVAVWEVQASVSLFPEQILLLLDSGMVQDIRNNVHFEVTPRPPEQGQPFVAHVSFIDQLHTQSGDLTDVNITLTQPDSQEVTFDQSTTPALEVLVPGALVSVETAYPIPALASKGAEETDETYLARLGGEDGVLVEATANATATSSGGPVSAPQDLASTTQLIPIVTLTKSGPETVEPGTTVTYDLALNNIGSAEACKVGLEDLLPGNDLGTISDAPEGLDPGDSVVAHASHVLPMAQPPGDLMDVAAALWEDANENLYGPLTDTFTTEVLSLVPDGVLILAPAYAGPNVIDTQQTLIATFKDTSGTTLPGVAIQFAVTGPNVMMGEVISEADGTAAFTYTGTNNGYDSVQAMAVMDGTTFESNIATVHWITPVQSVTTSTIWGRFFEADNSGRFNTPPTQMPIFGQAFPSINFNPPAGTVPGNTSGVGVRTRPFTNVTMDLNGNYAGTIVAQGNGKQAGVGTLYDFSAVFTGEFTIKEAGNVIYDFYSDDGFIFGIGNGAQRVGGANANPPSSGLTPFEGYPVMGAYNIPTSPVRNSITVFFPGPGAYPFEIDYTECCGGELALTLAVRETGFGVTPLGALTISPNSRQTHVTGEQQTFTVSAQDASGLPLTDMMVMLRISGANTQEMTAVTDLSGIATFTYTGNNVGSDIVQAVAWAQGSISAYSAEVGVNWQRGAPPPTDPGTPLAVPGWIGSPANQSSLTGLVPIRLKSGVTLQNGTLDYWPSDDTSAVVVLATGLSGTGTLATLDTTLLANGSYIIRLQGTDTSGNQVNSGIVVTVEGEYKPGRVRFNLVDLTVPVTGLPITIGRTYDSLERSRSGDFGYGWELAIGNPRVEVSPANDVTITMPDGRRVTFFFTPYAPSPWFGFLLVPDYTPEAGVYGNLTGNGCGLLTVSGGKVFCFPGGLYSATEFTYTDPYGRVYVMESSGTLRSITDLSGNTLTFSDSGITSSVGLSVLFERDSAGRIIRITGPEGNVYQYSYNDAGDLELVSLPNMSGVIQYNYDNEHFFLEGIDPRGNQVVLTVYDDDGRLIQQTDALGNNTVYTYNLDTRTTYVTNPDGGTNIFVESEFGDLLSQANALGNTWTYEYDENRNMISETNPLGKTTRFTYDENGYRNSATDPLGSRLVSVDYNQTGGPTSVTDALGNVTTFTYDSTFRLTSANDGIGLLGGYSWDARGNPRSLTNGDGETTNLTFDTFGNVIGLTDPLGNTTSYTYDLLGQRLTETDPLGNTKTFNYDALGRLTSWTDPLGNTTRFEYDANGNLTNKTDPLGRQTSYVYDIASRLIEIGNPDGTIRTYTYDFRGNLLTDTDEVGQATRYAYDLAGQLLSITRAVGTVDEAITSYAYDAAGHRVSTTNPRGYTTTFMYDGAGRLIMETDPEGGITTYEYDVIGRLVRIVEANGNVTQYAYDMRGRLSRTTFPDDTTISQEYDGTGRLIASMDRSGQVVQYSYDMAGRLIDITRAAGTTDESTSHYFYDAAGRRITATDPLGNNTNYSYDDAGRLTLIVNPLGAETRHVYDEAGQLISTTDPNGHPTGFTYDDRGRLTQTLFPDGSAATNAYDATGRMISSTDRGSRVTAYIYDATSRLISVTNPLGDSTVYAYDAAGNLISILDPNGNETTFEYDSLDRRIKKTWPDGSFETFSFDPLGNMISHRLADGNINSFTYDETSRLINASYFDGQVFSYTYTPTGLRSSVMDSRGTTSYVYDALERLMSITTPDDLQITYTYDVAGNRTGMSTPADTVNYAYDGANRLTEVTNSSGGTATYTYDIEGRRTELTLPNDVTIEYGYDDLDRLVSLAHRYGAIVLASYDYQLDSAGNRTREIAADGSSIEWTYDALYRLIGETRRDSFDSIISETTFSYDSNGNRLTQTIDGVKTDYSYNTMDQLISTGGTIFIYDGRGNLTQTVAGTEVTTFAWDARDYLMSVTLPNGTSITNEYDANGRRISQTTDGSTINYLWDEVSRFGDVVLETDSIGVTLASYVLGETEILSQTRSGATNYYLPDAQGNIRSLTDGLGAVSDRYEYTAFGEIFSSTGTTANNYLFIGQQFDNLTGLYSLRARYYDPSKGRFLSRDPVEAQIYNTIELNRYAYAANNPINYIDPSGQLYIETALQDLSALEQAFILTGMTGLVFLATLQKVREDVGIPTITWPEFPYISPDGTDPNKKPEPPRLSDAYKALMIIITTTLLTGLISEGIQPVVEGEPQPVEPVEPEPTPVREVCDAMKFQNWWWSLDPRLSSYRPGEDWYEYEQRVARAAGIYGNYARVVLTGPIDADGIEPASCCFVEAKYSADPNETQWSFDGPQWAAAQALNEFMRYNTAVKTPNGILGAQPQGLIVRTPFEISRPFFENLLIQAGFTINIDGKVEILP